MKIGIIGTGNIGGTLARHLARLGHDVSIANSRRPETLARLAAETGATAVTVAQAARAGANFREPAEPRSGASTSPSWSRGTVAVRTPLTRFPGVGIRRPGPAKSASHSP